MTEHEPSAQPTAVEAPPDPTEAEAPIAPPREVRRLTLNLSPEIYEEMRALADQKSISLTELVRRAVAREKFFHEHKDQQVILRDGEREQIVVML